MKVLLGTFHAREGDIDPDRFKLSVACEDG